MTDKGLNTRILMFILAACLSAIAAMATQRVKIGEIYYHLDPETHTAEVASAVPDSENMKYLKDADVEKYNAHYLSGKVVFPETVSHQGIQYSVTGIGKKALAYSPLQEVVIPMSVATIGESAFMWSGLQSVTIMNPAIKMGKFAFSACRSLMDVNLPEGLAAIGEDAFNYAGIRNIRIPDSVTEIGLSAFRACENLESITFPTGITTIPHEVCGNCKNLKKAVLPNGLTAIGSYAFIDCVSLMSINIPSTVTIIDVGAFHGCKALPTLTVPAKASIEADAFYGAHGYKRGGSVGNKTNAKPSSNKKPETKKRTSIYD